MFVRQKRNSGSGKIRIATISQTPGTICQKRRQHEAKKRTCKKKCAKITTKPFTDLEFTNNWHIQNNYHFAIALICNSLNKAERYNVLRFIILHVNYLKITNNQTIVIVITMHEQ